MSSANPIAAAIDDSNIEYEKIRTSEAALRGDDIDGLRAVPHEELALIAWRALNVIRALGRKGFTYDIAMIEQHLECPGDCACMWIVAQGDTDGGFNKMVKAFGASCEPNGEEGPSIHIPLAVFHTWDQAREYLRAHPVGSRYNRIYPVVVTAGREPRTTKPVDEL